MIDTLKANFPQAQIDFLVDSRVAELIDDYPNINKVQCIEKDSIKTIRGICKSGLYDIAIIVHSSFNIAFALFFSPVKYRLGTGYRWYSFLFNIRHYQHRKYSERHELEYNLGLLNELNCKIPERIEPVLLVKESAVERIREIAGSKGLELSQTFVIIHPGTMGSAKVWGQKNFIKLLNLLTGSQDLNCSIVLTGSGLEKEMIESIYDKISIRERIYKFTELSLTDFVALIKFAKIFISNSTGPIHIAAALGTFVIGFYPSKRVESAIRWGPYTEKKKVFSSTMNNDESPFMDDILPEDVFSFIQSYLKNN